MNCRTIYKKLSHWHYEELAKKIHQLVRKEPIDFTLDDVLNLIYDFYEQTNDENLAYLYVDISNNGFLVKEKWL